MKLTKQIKTDLAKAYQGAMEISILDMKAPLRYINQYISENISGYGTAADEKVRSRGDYRKMLMKSRQQSKGMLFKAKILTSYQPKFTDETTAQFHDEILVQIGDKKNKHSIHLYMSCVFKFQFNKWQMVMFHGSMPDAASSTEDTFHVGEAEKKVKELEKIVAQRTLDLQAKNKELEIEASLERVRTVTMAMNVPDDILNICKVFFTELKALGFKYLRNALINFWDDENDLLHDYDYSDFAGGNFAKLSYSSHPTFEEFQKKIRKAKDAFAKLVIEKDGLKSWQQRRRSSGEYKDPRLDKIIALYYYFYSTGAGALGISTFKPISKDEVGILKRFRNVFDLAYLRYLEIEKAAAQAQEAKIEAALERVRSAAMSMRKSEELIVVCEAVYNELKGLGFESIRNAQISIRDTIKQTYYGTEYSDHIRLDMPNAPSNSSPVIKEIYDKIEKSKDAFYQKEFTGKKFKDWRVWRMSMNAQTDSRLAKATSMWFYLYSIGQGYLGISTFNKITDGEVEILKRFKNVFELSYQRYTDVANAEGQAREAKIEAALERTRTQSMIMQHSNELDDTLRVFHEQILLLGIHSAFSFLWLPDEKNDQHIFWAIWEEKKNGATNFKSKAINYPLDRNEPATSQCLIDWKSNEPVYSYHVPSAGVKNYFAAWHELIDDVEQLKPEYFSGGLYYVEAFMKYGCFGVMVVTDLTEDEKKILGRFAIEFERTYTRFLDLQKAEAQAREAQIELALERVRARTMAMQRSEELKDAAALLFQQVKSLGVPAYSCGYNIWEKDDKEFTSWMSIQDGSIINGVPNIPLTEDANFIRYVESKQKGEQFFVLELRGERMQQHYEYLKTIPAFKIYFDYAVSVGFDLPETQIHHLANFSQGNLLFITLKSCPEYHDVFKRFSVVFEQTYTRFLDLQKAEAQAREARIELGLERVRARAMSMQSSEELKELIGTVFTELTKLDLMLTRCVIMIYNSEESSSRWWMANSEDPKNPAGFFIKRHEHPPMVAYFKAWHEREIKYTYALQGKTKKEWDKFLFSETELKNLPDFVIEGMKEPELVYLNASFNNFGNLTLASLEPLSNEHFDILLRFAKVFDLTYTRFNDLQKAEAQAKEARIETALEKVRSRSLAMQKSEELKEVIQVVYEQFVHLNVNTEHAGFVIDYKQRDDRLIWVASKYGVPSQLTIPYFDSEYYNSFNKAKEKGLDFFDTNLNFEQKNSFYRQLFTYIPDLPEEAKEFYFNCSGLAISTVLLENVGLYIENFEGVPYSDEDNAILMRFGKVFQQTYTRFLDLQKAEAQTREAQIEAALEKVRSRSLAMHQSDELQQVVNVVFGKLMDLGILIDSASIIVLSEIKEVMEYWVSVPGQEYSSHFRIPYFDDTAVSRDFIAARANGTNFSKCYTGKDKNDQWSYLFEHSDLKHIPDDRKKFLVDTSAYTVSVTFTKNTALQLLRYHEQLFSEKDNEVFQRFANVFEQAYIRFLDLKKAEAQAKEAKIETSLERIRAKAMAMHHSDELDEVLEVLFDQFDILGINPMSTHMTLIDLETNTFTFRETGKGGRRSFGEQVVAIDSMDIWKQQGEKWRTSEPLSVNRIHFPKESLPMVWQIFHESFFSMPEDAKIVPEDYPDGIYHTAGNCKFGYIGMNQIRKATEEEEQIVLKFATEFGRFYQRFLDLKKAEAQAKEAKIEASLERVRSKAMSMQKSEDLAQAITIVFEELDKLDLGMLRCGIGVLHKENRSADVWSTTIADNNKIVQVAGYESMDIHPLLSGVFDAWLKHEEFAYFLQGEDLNNYYKAIRRENFTLPESQSLIEGTEGVVQYYYNTVFSSGGLFAFGGTPFTEEAKSILRRFADVFSLTYTRFNDLRQAEAQAKEAKIEVALERVRSRTLAMQKSEELAETAVVLFSQLIGLGIEPNRLYIGIIKDESGDMEMWATDEDGTEAGTKFMFNRNENASVKKLYDGWASKMKSQVVDMQGKELDEYFHYLKDVLKIPFKGGLLQKRRVQHVAYFAKGFIGMASPDEQSEESIQLLERFAAVFNLTFTRFNDLKLAEAHAEQAEIDLIKLQTEKKRAEDALMELRSTQTQLIQSEKMASLGELTAGIAHEIQNPLNFVNNFSEVSTELLDEMMDEVMKGNYGEVKSILDDVKLNLQKINHHGKRADGIVKGMLQHSRSSSGQMEPTNINVLADEYLRLAYHGLRAKDKSFNATLKTDYDASVGNINIIPQDIGRVVLNLITNAFYAADERKKSGIKNYEPTVSVSTKKMADKILISVRDNGNGIPEKLLDKIFQPFFTTKPTGQGTGLGLSLSYDIIKAHSGTLKVETKESEGSTFIIQLPIHE